MSNAAHNMVGENIHALITTDDPHHNLVLKGFVQSLTKNTEQEAGTITIVITDSKYHAPKSL